MKRFLAIIIIFISTTSYNELSNKRSPIEERLLIQKSFDNTEKEIERINKILDDPYRLYKIKNK